MVAYLLFRLPHHHDAPIACPEHLDGGGVEAGERLGGDDLFWCSDLDLPVGDVHHAVDWRQEGIDIMGHEQHRRPCFLADLPDHARHTLLVA